MRSPLLFLFSFVVAGSTVSFGQQTAPPEKAQKRVAAKKPAEKYAAGVPEPTLSEIKYGDHPRHVIDFGKRIPTPPRRWFL